jgi:hypothetical protein
VLAKPFVGMARSRLIALLIVFVGLEIAGALGLVLANRPTSAAPVVAPASTAIPVPDVQSSTPTLTVGTQTLFSAQLPAVANQEVTYQIRYPDGTVRFLYARADASGSSQILVKISTHARVPHGTVGVGLYYHNKKYAFTHFPVAGN